MSAQNGFWGVVCEKIHFWSYFKYGPRFVVRLGSSTILLQALFSVLVINWCPIDCYSSASHRNVIISSFHVRVEFSWNKCQIVCSWPCKMSFSDIGKKGLHEHDKPVSTLSAYLNCWVLSSKRTSYAFHLNTNGNNVALTKPRVEQKSKTLVPS